MLAHRLNFPLADRIEREMGGLLDSFLDGGRWGMARAQSFPPVNVWEDSERLYVETEIPGIDPKEVDVRLEGNVLTIRGEKKQEQEEKRRNYHYVERQYGAFHRSVQLPASVDPEKVEAGYHDGVLTVTIAKRPEATARRITVKSE